MRKEEEVENVAAGYTYCTLIHLLREQEFFNNTLCQLETISAFLFLCRPGIIKIKIFTTGIDFVDLAKG